MTTTTFTITGMHCPSCAMNIDGELEDTQGITCAKTNYAKQETQVTYDATKIASDTIAQVIKKAGYTPTQQP